MERLMKKENPKKLATQDIQETRHIHVREYRKGNEKGQSRGTDNIRYTRDKKNQDNPEKLATQVHKTQEKINVREYGRENEKKVQRNWQHSIYKRQDK